jgi:F-box/WD-40 domain protein 7
MKSLDLLVSGSGDKNVILWKLQNEKLNLIDKVVLNAHQSDIYCVDVFDEYIASGGADSLIIIWNTYGDLLYKLSGHLGIVRCLHLDEFKLVSSGDAKKVMIWNYRVLNLLFKRNLKMRID